MIHPMRSGQQRRRAYMRVAEVVRAARQQRFFESLDVDEEHSDLTKDKNRLDPRDTHYPRDIVDVEVFGKVSTR